MKGNLGDRQRIEHIREALVHIESFTNGLNYQAYIDNFQLRLALVKLLEIVGEAAAAISSELQEEF
ncbi:HepT-like ribonuclease domain-containing protein [Larkinella soli]|uniref:HepT-like ribonuclease domain-containing protein n=1 Tax=Larkinella soli TaxID=1770527 RepID=UPI000FFBB3DA|nr:HepT-like ribonuclease domain-containing protein [Larkinella soli]